MTSGKMVLEDAIARHREAVAQLLSSLDPEVPLPRMRRFHLGEGWVWPSPHTSNIRDAVYQYGLLGGDRWDYINMSDPSPLYRHLGGQPAKVYRAIVQIRRATEWCLKRAEGRARHAQEILRQQEKEADLLEREKLLIRLRKERK